MSVYPTIFKGYRSSRIFISGNNVSSDNYIYAKEIKGIWSQSDGKSCRFDKIMINKDYFDENFLKNNKCSKPNKYIDAPPVIKLEDHEKFYNNDDEIVEIEVLGERDPNNCYFKLRDIALGFDMHGLRKVILDERRDGYQLNKHYVIFHWEKNAGTADKKNKCVIKKEIFMTYLGILRILFASKKTTADKFASWATNILFTAQMGSEKQKLILVSSLLGVPMDSVRAVFDKSSDNVSCNYLFSLGTVKELRQKLNIPDDWNDNDTVAKFGTTADMKRRLGENKAEYKKIGVDLELLLFNQVDPQYTFQSETCVKRLFRMMNLNLVHNHYKELVIIPKKRMNDIREGYSNIATKYMGHVKEFILTIERKDNIIEKKDNIIEKKDAEIIFMNERHEKELLKKDLEIIALKKDLEMANYKRKKRSSRK